MAKPWRRCVRVGFLAMFLLVQKKQDRRLVVHLSGEAEVDPGRTSVGVVPAVARGSSWRGRREHRRQVGAEAEELKGGSGGGRSRDTGRRGREHPGRPRATRVQQRGAGAWARRAARSQGKARSKEQEGARRRKERCWRSSRTTHSVSEAQAQGRRSSSARGGVGDGRRGALLQGGCGWRRRGERRGIERK